MTKNEELKQVLESSTFDISGNVRNALYVLIVAGVGCFVSGLFGHHQYLAWQALLINTTFFAGLAHAGLMFSVICAITDAQWARPIKRFSEATASFIPVSWLLFVILFFGAEHIYEWVDHDKVIHSKEGWLNFSFFVKRNVILILITGLTSIYYVKTSIRPDLGLAQGLVDRFKSKIALGAIENYQDQVVEVERTKKNNRVIAIILAFLYLLFSSIVAFDWIMSIDQEWFSTMFGVQYMVASFLSAGAFIMIVSGIAREKFKIKDYLTLNTYHDLSKLTFAASLLWTYMIFSQVIVIWYANLPEETPYLILRMKSQEWGWMFWFLMIVIWQIPFWGLMSKTACRSTWFSRIIAIDILIGVWLEKFFLIVPSMQENKIAAMAGGSHHGAQVAGSAAHLPGFTINYMDIGLALGLGAAFVLCFLSFLKTVPVLPISDPHLVKDGGHH